MYDRGVVKGISIGCFSKKFFCWTSMIRGRAATTTKTRTNAKSKKISKTKAKPKTTTEPTQKGTFLMR